MLDNSKPLVVVSLFDGISCGLQALKNSGYSISGYYASEIDKKAISVSEHNHPEIIRLGDVSNVSIRDGWLSCDTGRYYVGKIDLILAGSPCQGFSFAGKQLNFEDPRSKLYFQFKRILSEAKRDNLDCKFLLENVKMKQEYIDYIEQDLECNQIPLNSKHFSAQNRPRHYWTDIIDDQQKERLVAETKDLGGVHLKSILEDRGYIGVWTWPRGYNKGGTRDTGKMPCITTSSWQHNFLVERVDGSRRKFTPVECERAQGLPDNYTSCLSDNQRYIVLGNCWTVSVIEKLLEYKL